MADALFCGPLVILLDEIGHVFRVKAENTAAKPDATEFLPADQPAEGATGVRPIAQAEYVDSFLLG